MANKKKKKKSSGSAVKAAPKVNMGPVTNPGVKSAIAALKQGNTPEKQNALTEALKSARLLSPCAIDAVLKPGERINIKANQIRVYMLNTNDGKTLFPAFTDAEEAGKFRVQGENEKTPQNVVRTIAEFDKMLSAPDCKATGIVINPGTDNIVIPKQLAAVIAGRVQMPQRVVQQKVPANAPVNVRYSEPAVYPTRMVNAVYEHCAETPAISRVWLKQKISGVTMGFFMPVEADSRDPAILEGIRAIAEPMAKDLEVEVVFISDQIMKDVIGEAAPLYDRELEL